MAKKKEIEKWKHKELWKLAHLLADYLPKKYKGGLDFWWVADKLEQDGETILANLYDDLQHYIEWTE